MVSVVIFSNRCSSVTLSTCPQVPQVSRSLAEQVLSKCASKLKNYLTEAVKSSGVSLDKYSKVVASICEGTFSALQQDQLVENEKEVSLLICFSTQSVLYITRFSVELCLIFWSPSYIACSYTILSILYPAG